MIYTESDNLIAVKAGDTIEMHDGTIHEAVYDDMHITALESCNACSMNKDGDCLVDEVECAFFHFKQLTSEL